MSISNKHNKNQINIFCNKLKDNVYSSIGNLGVEAWITKEPVSYQQKTSGKYMKLSVGDSWGQLWDCGWMHFKGTIPETAKDKKVVLIIDISGEGCVFDNDGNPVRGITTKLSTYDFSLGKPVKRILQFCEKSTGNEIVDIWIETGCNDLFDGYIDNGILKQAEIAICNENLRQLYYDYYFLLMLSESLEDCCARKSQIEGVLFEVASSLTNFSDDEVNIAREKLSFLLNMQNSDESLKVTAIGHSHIDLAWLWPIRETKRKAARTFSTVFELMDRYPDYVFGASQPQLYQWVKDLYPKLYDKIKEKVKENKWECQGAMWVEPDTNISSGEALVRQILYGKKFFKEEFDKDIKVLWLPDVFGYSASLPQILKKSDVPYFMTIKLSWNDHNVFPRNTFIWKGIDGSEILAHIPPENTYNSGAMPKSLVALEKNFKDKDVSDEALMLFGIGDGGGGPSTNHLEYLKREKNIAGLPKVKQEPAIEFFERVNVNRDKYKKWYGELYLERHQGTYTTQANSKKYNRLLELSLRDCEFVCSIAKLYTGYDYPQQEIETIWKEVLLYQFHDILPGSSIKRVYDESLQRYEELYIQVKEIIENACQKIAKDMEISQNEILAFNTLPWVRQEKIEMNSQWKEVEIEPYSWAVLDCSNTKEFKISTVVNTNTLENDFIRTEFNNDGTIKSIYDKGKKREILNVAFRLNNLLVFEDMGDCWDIPFTYVDKLPEQPKVVKCEILTERTNNILRFHYEYGMSKITQDVLLGDNSKKLIFKVNVDWQETHKMLRGRYPIDITANEATCEIQFGHIKRPTHQNTSWDYAKFEVCAQKWVDLSENGFGVALINNCKYGHRLFDNVLDINLLRSPMYPGENADKGVHKFSFELFIHDGDLIDVIEEAYKFNTDLIFAGNQNGKGLLPRQNQFMKVSESNIVVEAIKLAEDKSGYIVRLYECDGKSTVATINVKGMKSAVMTNLIETEQFDLNINDNIVELNFKPFEIHTIKVKV